MESIAREFAQLLIMILEFYLLIMGSYNKRCYSHGSYERGFLQPWLVTTRGLKTGGSYNKESYIRGFLQPGFLQSGVLHVQPGLVTSKSLTTKGSYNHGFLQQGL